MHSGNIDGVSVVVPVYNSAPTLCLLIESVTQTLRNLGLPYEIILVNDGSRDSSWQQITALTREKACVSGINLARNYGQHNALLAGIRAAAFDVIVTMDDDLQNPPEEIPKLLSTLAEGYDVVYGVPHRVRHGLWRDIASAITKFALRSAMGIKIAQQTSSFRALRTRVRDAFTHYSSPFVSIDVLLTWGTGQFGAVQVRQDYRQVGASNYTFRKLLTHALNMLTGFSTWPLQLASLIGFAFTLFGFGILAYVLVRYVSLGGSVPGFPFLASLIAIFSGAQLFALGIIGEYIARMHLRSMERPPYVIESRQKPDVGSAAGPFASVRSDPTENRVSEVILR